MKTRITRSTGYIALVYDVPGDKPHVLASMTLHEGTGCWQMTDLRLSKHQKPSEYSGCLIADKINAHITYKNDIEKEIALKMLREYEIDEEKKTITWCTYDGLIKGHESIDGYAPPWASKRLGFFTQKEGVQKLHEIKAFWDVFEGDFESARQPNPLRQPFDSDIRFAIYAAANNIDLSEPEVGKNQPTEKTQQSQARQDVPEASDKRSINEQEVKMKTLSAEALLREKITRHVKQFGELTAYCATGSSEADESWEVRLTPELIIIAEDYPLDAVYRTLTDLPLMDLLSLADAAKIEKNDLDDVRLIFFNKIASYVEIHGKLYYSRPEADSMWGIKVLKDLTLELEDYAEGVGTTLADLPLYELASLSQQVDENIEKLSRSATQNIHRRRP